MGNCFRTSHIVSSSNHPEKKHKKLVDDHQISKAKPTVIAPKSEPRHNNSSVVSKKSDDICFVRRRRRDAASNNNPNPRYCIPKCRILDTKKANHKSASVSDAKVDGGINNRYILGDELGRGEFGVTYLCTDKFSSNVYACKSISKKKNANGKFINIKDIRSEIRIMKRLPRHPNIVNLKDFYEDSTTFYIVMDLCQGGELFDRIVTQNHHSEHDAAMIIKTIVQVVQVCHNHGVMHRDLKPENFLYVNNRAISPLKVIDFGISAIFKPGERLKEMVGSPLYMAPEVLRRDYVPEIDIWSTGVILYILLSGFPPFTIGCEELTFMDVLHAPIDLCMPPWPEVSSAAKDLVRQMLNRNTSERLSAQQVLDHPWLLQYSNGN